MPRRTRVAGLIVGSLALFGLAVSPAHAVVPATVTPTNINFNAIHVGTPRSANITVKLAAGYFYAGVSGTGTTGPFSVNDTISSPCYVPGPGSCVLAQSFQPQMLATVHAQTDIHICAVADSANCTVYSVTMSGSGQPPATINPTSLNLGSVIVGNRSKPVAASVKLDPGYDVSGFVGGTDGRFDVLDVGADCITPGSTCTFHARFTPDAVGPEKDTLLVEICPAHGSNPCVNAKIPMSGTGTAPGTVAPTSISFGTVHLGVTVSKTVTVKVLGGDHVQSIMIADTNEGSPFDVLDESPGCDALDGPTTCTFTATYKPYRVNPTALPAETNSIQVTLCTPDGAHCTLLAIPVNGRGAIPGTLTPTSIAFGSVQTGARLTKPVTVKPDAGWEVDSANGSTNNTDDVFVASSDGCVVGATSCVIPVTFAPVAIGARTGAAHIRLCPITDVNYEPCVSLPRVTLTGTGTAPATVSPTAVAFGNVKTHSFLNKTVTVTLKAGWEMSPDPLDAGGPPFSAHEDLICHTVNTTKCTIQVTFAPQTTGARSATLPLTVCQTTTSLCVSLAPVKLTGTGT